MGKSNDERDKLERVRRVIRSGQSAMERLLTSGLSGPEMEKQERRIAGQVRRRVEEIHPTLYKPKAKRKSKEE